MRHESDWLPALSVTRDALVLSATKILSFSYVTELSEISVQFGSEIRCCGGFLCIVYYCICYPARSFLPIAGTMSMIILLPLRSMPVRNVMTIDALLNIVRALYTSVG